jgi:hypothetical protein
MIIISRSIKEVNIDNIILDIVYYYLDKYITLYKNLLVYTKKLLLIILLDERKRCKILWIILSYISSI